MMIHFLEIAQQELDEAVAFHEAQAKGLGQVFLAEVLAALELMRRHPEGWQQLSRNTRRCRLRRFPYGVIYLADQSEILIVAIAHLHRRPDYWHERIQADKT
ncbi:MAG: type II toxin-antitoxin system RelE/ParE family toxin [Magnetococcales bacterium]|nr:type II toxin-antitoxin system RelE/ParE family toxin [Magnetococcales bacterium]